MLGGSTTSLLSLLHNIDYEKYDVDLLLYRNEGPFIDYTPEKVNLLEQAYIPHSKLSKTIKCVFNGTIIKALFQGVKYFHKWSVTRQGMAYAQAHYAGR